jgi:hypothetical protein
MKETWGRWGQRSNNGDNSRIKLFLGAPNTANEAVFENYAFVMIGKLTASVISRVLIFSRYVGAITRIGV